MMVWKMIFLLPGVVFSGSMLNFRGVVHDKLRGIFADENTHHELNSAWKKR